LEFLAQLKSHQSVIDSQFLRIPELQKEKSKLKGYIVKYETELRNWESKAKAQAAAQSQLAAASQQQQQHYQQSVSVMQHSMSIASPSFVVEHA
jgi:septal ring factor EnvC (AmiA/AmiB activator)